MDKLKLLFIICFFQLSACSAPQTASDRTTLDKHARLDCEQQAAVAQAGYLARIKTPMYTSSFSSTWAGGARSDTGAWVFDKVLQSCVLRAQHAGHH